MNGISLITRQASAFGNRWVTGVIIATLALTLSACGFQLRGYTEIPDSLKKLYLTAAGSSSTLPSIKRLMKANGISLEEGMVSAAYHLTILQEDHQRRSISLSSTAKTEEYELRSAVTFQVKDRMGKIVISPTTVYTERVYRFDEDNINAGDAEEALLRREMYDNLAQQVLRRYLALAKTPSQ